MWRAHDWFLSSRARRGRGWAFLIGITVMLDEEPLCCEVVIQRAAWVVFWFVIAAHEAE
jgi:DNA-binding FrmR family transcriptional regulator